jgi:hypothetical protein
LVSDGTYSGTGFKNINFKGKSIWARSKGGAASCIINSESARAFYFVSGESPETVVEGFTVTGGAITGAGVYCLGASPTLITCFVRDNTLSGQSGAGVYLKSSSPVFINCCIARNTCTQYGGGVYCDSSSPVFVNCTITDNTASTGGGIGVYGDSKPILKNTILWGNISTVNNGHEIWTDTADSRIWLYSCDYADNTTKSDSIEGNGTCTADSNCIVADPKFIDPTNRNYRLQSASPCRDAANAVYLPVGVGRVAETYDAAAYPRFYNYKLDIGAYEYKP